MEVALRGRPEILGLVIFLTSAPVWAAHAEWTETLLYSFTGKKDGASPSGVVFGPAGRLYGQVPVGGLEGYGDVFEMLPPAAGKIRWKNVRLHSSHLNGNYPDSGGSTSGVVFDAAGTMYGTSGYGDYNQGQVFALTPPAAGKAVWTKRAIHSFTGGDDGGRPYAGVVMDAAGDLYGTTLSGGPANDGTVFKLAPPASGKTAWTESVLHSFAGGKDGATPYAPVTFDQAGNVYGSTSAGGTHNAGTIFMLTPPAAGGGDWTETILYNFTGGADGKWPGGALILDSAGKLYGTAGGGVPACGNPPGCGVAFMLSPPSDNVSAWTETVLHSFTGKSDGAEPDAGLVFGDKGKLYGTTFIGGHSCAGSGGCGTVYVLVPPSDSAGWTHKVIYAFKGAPDGSLPSGGLVLDAAGNLYGTTGNGGIVPNGQTGSGWGTMFQLSP